MRIFVIVVGLLLFPAAVVWGQTWTLVWSDEFDGTTLNTSNWTYDLGAGGWGNQELENYTNRNSNVCVTGGNLLIIAQKESYGGSEYTSARIKTQNLRTFAYGRIEARIQLPSGKGIWPAFWMLGNNIPTAGWPLCGELDIMEHINTESTIYGTIHWRNKGSHVSSGRTITIDPRGFHVYAIEWNADSIHWSVDDRRYFSYSLGSRTDSLGAFHLPFFILLNVAVGGTWPGVPNATTTFPDTMAVDYVRVYRAATSVDRDEIALHPDRSSLFQNFPNPFNPSTVIPYTLHRHAHVELTVYDMMGRVAAVLVDREQEPGSYEVRFDGMDLNNGIYFYRLGTGGQTAWKKMVLLK